MTLSNLERVRQLRSELEQVRCALHWEHNQLNSPGVTAEATAASNGKRLLFEQAGDEVVIELATLPSLVSFLLGFLEPLAVRKLLDAHSEGQASAKPAAFNRPH